MFYRFWTILPQNQDTLLVTATILATDYVSNLVRLFITSLLKNFLVYTKNSDADVAKRGYSYRCTIYFLDSLPASDIILAWYDDHQAGSTFIENLRERPMSQYAIGSFRLSSYLTHNFQDENDKSKFSH